MKSFVIFYQKPQKEYSESRKEWIERLSTFEEDGKKYTVESVYKTHAIVACIAANDLEDVFTKMQGENWSPHGEAKSVIERTGVEHTSMSVNDVALDVLEGKYYRVARFGFEEVPIEKIQEN